MLAIEIIDAASVAAAYIQGSLFYLFVTVKSPVISAICVGSCVFIGPSHKKIKFFVFFAE
jgi:hypothetical protein